MASIEEIRARYTAHGQEHVLAFYDELSPEEQAELLADLQSVDLDEIQAQFVRATSEPSEGVKLDNDMTPLSQESLGNATAFPPTEEMNGWMERGLKAVSEGKVAALLLAGGQGTRLGSSDPKGMFPLDLPSGLSLFGIQALRIRRVMRLAEEKYGKTGVIPWYIMTSGATKQKTIDYFNENKFFGLNPSDVMFFEQFQIPSLGLDGKLLLASKSSLARNPDGNGGLYYAMEQRGVLADMTKRGIEDVHVYCVDNILVKVVDPVFMGFCKSMQAPAGALVVGKSHPTEAVGVVCKVKDRFQVVEYSEICLATAERRNPDGRLTFAEGNIANHYFTVDFLRQACARSKELKEHRADKKIPFVDPKTGELVKPEKNNGIKLEKFVFDVFGFADKLAVLEVAREDNFSPLKNALGASSGTVQHCRADLFALHRRYLAHARVMFVDENHFELDAATLDGSHVCEISPLVSYAGEGLEDFVKANPRLSFPIVINEAPSSNPVSPKKAKTSYI